MGLGSLSTAAVEGLSPSSQRVRKFFVLTNYFLLGAASGCIFLILSLRLFPSLCGFLLIFLHLLAMGAAIFGCVAATSSGAKTRWYALHMVGTVLTAIFEGSVSVLIYTRTDDFLQALNSYVKEEDGVIILRLAGGLCVATFFLQWIVVGLAFSIRYYAYVDQNNGSTIELGGDGVGRRNGAKVQDSYSNWPWPFQV